GSERFGERSNAAVGRAVQSELRKFAGRRFRLLRLVNRHAPRWRRGAYLGRRVLRERRSCNGRLSRGLVTRRLQLRTFLIQRGMIAWIGFGPRLPLVRVFFPAGKIGRLQGLRSVLDGYPTPSFRGGSEVGEARIPAQQPRRAARLRDHQPC